MKIFNDYDSEKLIERTWYSSSNIAYSECYDIPNSYKELKIVFNSGRTYLYKGVDVNDYLLFREAKSQGKALNKYITKKDENGKPLYECIRLEDSDVTQIKEAMSEYDLMPTFLIDEENNIFSLLKGKNPILENKKVGDDSLQNIFEVLDALQIPYHVKSNKNEKYEEIE